MRFYTEERPYALSTTKLTEHAIRLHGYRIAKIESPLEVDIYERIISNKLLLHTLTNKSSNWILYYQEACRYWVKACEGLPFFRRNGVEMAPPHGRVVCFQKKESADFAVCLANSSLFYWFYSAFSDCEHINDGLLRGFYIPKTWEETDWGTLSQQLSNSIEEHSERKTISTKQGHKIEYVEINALNSKFIIDDIDRMLAKHYGFSEDEVDFIINYDIKYRMGQETGEEVL